MTDADGLHYSNSLQRPNTNDTLHERDFPFHNETGDPPTTTLYRSTPILPILALYSGLAIAAWTITCILSHRPISGLKNYAVDVAETNNSYGWSGPLYIQSLYIRNEDWYRAARVLQSIVSVLTIPLTCAVCSSAAVTFVQRARKGLTVRKVMVLADGGWTDPGTYVRCFLTRRGWSQSGSSLLLIAIALNLLGGIISPLQEVFLGSKSIKTPTSPQIILELVDIPDQFTDITDIGDTNFLTVMTRNMLMTATNTEPQALMWQGAGFTCNVLQLQEDYESGQGDGDVPFACGIGATFGNMSKLTDPFLAQISSGFSTGLIRQFIPRINSSARYENISADSWPENCATNPGSFWAEYGDDNLTWTIQACMPADMRTSPWKSTRDRQDFGEELFLNITTNPEEWGSDVEATPAGGELYKITVNTTAGYFELPNYMNGAVAGPLLDKDPNSVCGSDCELEGFDGEI